MTIFPTLMTSMPSPKAESELAWARTFLLARQIELRMTRRHRPVSHRAIRSAEKRVLAALSWVWDAQERAHAEAVRPFYEYLEAQHTKTFDALMKRMQRAMTRGMMRRLSAERA